MIPQSCPVPSNINPLQNNGYLLNIDKLPGINFFCQSVTIPNVQAANVVQPTPFVNIPLPGTQINFGNLIANFMIDGDLKNYTAVYDWMTGLGFPESREQFTNFIDGMTVEQASYSDIQLVILNASNNPAKTLRFVDAFPISLSHIEMSSAQSDTVYLIGSVAFTFAYFNFI